MPHPSNFMPRKDLLYPLYKRMGGTRASLDGRGEQKISFSSQDLNPKPPSLQLVAIQTTIPHTLLY
jgi:hypothetical protein